MAKKKKFKKQSFRNAAPRAARTSKAEDETSFKRLAYTAGGAAGTALAVSFLKREGWAPKTAATTLTAVGAGLTWKGDAPTIRSLGAGVMAGAGSQLAMMLIDKEGSTATAQSTKPSDHNTGIVASGKKPSNAEAVPAGALEAALERARARVAFAGNDAA
ncbi:MAG: hypothetical protein ABJA80_05725 [bacterium]